MREQGVQVLWIDDEIDTTMRYFVQAVRLAGHVVDTIHFLAEAMDKLDQYGDDSAGAKPDVVILDIMMPVRAEDVARLSPHVGSSSWLTNSMQSGLALLGPISRKLQGVPIIALTNLGEESEVGHEVLTFLKARTEVYAVLAKPQPVLTLIKTIQEASGRKP